MKFIICNLAIISMMYMMMVSSSRIVPNNILEDIKGDDAVKSLKTLVVGQSGKVDFRTIQAAIDSIPLNNNKWIKIYLQQGIYNEKIIIPREKEKIIIQGNNPSNTIIQYNEAGPSVSAGPFQLNAQFFIGINITFQNNYGKKGDIILYNDMNVAPAAILLADKAWFYGCSFIGVQDTLADLVGRHFFQHCYIEGAVDFIWGQGQSIYQGCTMFVRGVIEKEKGQMIAGFVTAQGRDKEEDTSGFVFDRCEIKGNGKALLGRAYRGYSRVVFYRTYMSNVIVPQGWEAWGYKGQEDKITYEEVECKGEGANKKGRVGWEKNLSAKDVEFFTNPKSFIDTDNWMSILPPINFKSNF